MVSSSTDTPAMFRGLARMDPDIVESLLGMQLENMEASKLTPREYALVKIAALVAMDASPASYAWQVGFAQSAGLTEEELLGVLVALAPTVGNARIVSAAVDLAFSLGHEVDELK